MKEWIGILAVMWGLYMYFGWPAVIVAAIIIVVVSSSPEIRNDRRE